MTKTAADTPEMDYRFFEPLHGEFCECDTCFEERTRAILAEEDPENVFKNATIVTFWGKDGFIVQDPGQTLEYVIEADGHRNVRTKGAAQA